MKLLVWNFQETCKTNSFLIKIFYNRGWRGVRNIEGWEILRERMVRSKKIENILTPGGKKHFFGKFCVHPKWMIHNDKNHLHLRCNHEVVKWSNRSRIPKRLTISSIQSFYRLATYKNPTLNFSFINGQA